MCLGEFTILRDLEKNSRCVVVIHFNRFLGSRRLLKISYENLVFGQIFDERGQWAVDGRASGRTGGRALSLAASVAVCLRSKQINIFLRCQLATYSELMRSFS